MLTDQTQWSLGHGNPVVPSRWQATGTCIPSWPSTRGTTTDDARTAPSNSDRPGPITRSPTSQQNGSGADPS